MAIASTRPQFNAQIAGARPEPVVAAPAPPIAQLAGGAAFVVDGSLRCLTVDGDAVRLAGLSPADVAGRSIGELLDPLLASRLEPHCRLALDGEVFAYEHEVRGRAYLWRGLPLRDAAGAVYAALVVSYDITDRRQAEALRRRSDETFATLIEHAPFAVYVVDAAFRLRAINRRAEPLFRGIEPLFGREFTAIAAALWPAPQADAVVREFRRTLATGVSYAAPRPGEGSGGGRMEVYDWQIQRITLPDGTPAVVCYAYDLTPIRHAERVLTEAAARDAFLVAFTDAVRDLSDARDVMAIAAARLGQALQASQVAYAEIDTSAGIASIEHDWNDGSMPSNRGRHRLDTLGSVGFVPDLEAGHTLVVDDVSRDPRTEREDVRAGFERIAIGAFLNVPLVKAGRLVATLSVHQAAPRAWQPHEIALAEEVAERTWAAVERVRADTERRESDARLKLALDASGLGTFVWHAAGGRAEPDARTLELIGLDAAGPSEAGVFERIVHPDDWPELRAAAARALDPAGSGLLRQDIRVRRRDGGLRWLAITARTVFDGNPREARRLAGVVADIEERKRIEAALREREEQLTDADRRKDEFLAVLAHELRNPLAPLRAGLEVIRLGGGSDATLGRTRAMMERQVAHMVRLIDDLLDVSRITSGKVHLQRRPTALETLVNTAVEAHREAIAAGRLTLDVQLPDGPVWLDVDPTRLVQVIGNVLHNAVKFTDPGGRIAVTATAEVAADGGGLAVLTIADTGMGIRAEMLPRVFDLFTQDRAGIRSHGGLGIGLALARQLVAMHGGTIEACSDGPGLGSRFTIALAAAATEGLPTTPVSAPTSRIRHRVVVIDDNLDAANAMAMLVTALGSEARVAGDGPTGVEQVLAWAPSLVLLDIGMPGVDGYETCRQIRRGLGSAVRIVAVTGWGQEQDKRDAQRAGFDAHLTKPADPQAIERLLAESPAGR